MTLPHEFEGAERELVRRLAQFRHELRSTGDAPSQATLEGLLQRADELRLPENEIGQELAEIRARLEALDVTEQLLRAEMPVAEAPLPLALGDTCHFACAVRFGRRRSDQFGHLVLSAGSLKFLGALDLSVAWSEIASVARNGRDLVVTLRHSHRVLRLSCHSPSEAARGGVIAEHLARAAQSATNPIAPHYQAI